MKRYIGERLKSIRVSKNLTTVQVNCLSRPTLLRVEKGLKPYSAKFFFDLVDFYNVEVILVKGGDVATVRSKEDMAKVLRRWRGECSYYSVAKKVSAVWERLRDIEQCTNYGIDQLLLYLEGLEVEMKI